MNQNASDPNLELTLPLNGRYAVTEILSTRLWARTYLAQDLHQPQQNRCLIHHIQTIPLVPNYATVMRGLLDSEAISWQQLGSHAQIPEQLDTFADEHGFYVVQEWINGHSLAQDLRSQPIWSVEAVLQLLHDVAEPLAWVHQHGSIHGNLKPNNLQRREANGQLVLIDFHGLEMLQRTFMSAHGLFVPPPSAAKQGYQPLEQLQGLPCAASDVYALGMIAVQALTGVHPVEFRVNPETVQIEWKERIKSPSHPLLAGLITILDTMLQWELPDRYANADQILMALNDLVAGAAPSPGAMANPATPQRRIVRPVVASWAKTAPPAARQTVPAETVTVAASVVTPQSSTPTHLTKPLPNPGSLPRLVPAWGMKLWLDQTIASPSVRLGAGGLAVATTVAAGGWGLLNSVDWSAKTNQLWSRLTEPTHEDESTNHRTIKTLTNQWRQDWQQATVKFQQAETAMQQREWAKAKQLAMAMPDIPYWRDRGTALAQEISTKLDTTASQQLQAAFADARDRRFTKALVSLNQISSDVPDSVKTIIQTKKKEYREKENIKAWFDLQQAYDHAIIQQFDQALTFLYQIPTGTDAYSIAQTKIAEYKEKATLQAQTRVSQIPAAPRPQARLVVATATLATVPSQLQLLDDRAPALPLDSPVEAEWQTLNQQAQDWLTQAQQQINAGELVTAITTLEKVPIGTPAYAQARDLILQLTHQLHPSTPADTPVWQARSDSRSPTALYALRETKPHVIGRATLQSVQ